MAYMAARMIMHAHMQGSNFIALSGRYRKACMQRRWLPLIYIYIYVVCAMHPACIDSSSPSNPCPVAFALASAALAFALAAAVFAFAFALVAAWALARLALARPAAEHTPGQVQCSRFGNAVCVLFEHAVHRPMACMANKKKAIAIALA